MFDLLYDADSISDGINYNKSMTIWQCEDILLVVLNRVVEIYFQTEGVVLTSHGMITLSRTDITRLWWEYNHLVVDVIFLCEQCAFRYQHRIFVTETGRYPMSAFARHRTTMELFTGLDPVWLVVNVVLVQKIATLLLRMDPDCRINQLTVRPKWTFRSSMRA
jgi:hypothetical protein